MGHESRRPTALRRRRLATILTALGLVVVGLTTGGASATAVAGEDLRAVKVDSALLSQLSANPTGGVTAIVTTWGRDGLDDVAALGVTGTKLRVLPMIITTALTQAKLDLLRRSPAVRSVYAERKYDLYMEDSTWITKARYVWSTAAGPATHQGFGLTGKGVELAMIDTGFDGLHEDGDNLIEFCETTGPAAATGSRAGVLCTPWVATFNPAAAGACGTAFPGASNTGPGPTTAAPGCRNKARGDSQDPDVSHGTHVGGTMVGTGHASGGKGFAHSTIGMSPDAKFRAYSANVGPSLLNTQTLAAYDDMTYKKEQGYSKVIAVNNSWGGGGGANYDGSDPTAIAVKRAYDAGIVSVFAAGNSGPEHDTLSAQCVNPYVVCVAATTKPDSIVGFSSKGRPSQPSDTNRDGVIDDGDVQPDNHDRLLGQKLELGLYRPTLSAPGVNINSMKAIGANIGDPGAIACREDDVMATENLKMSCYVQANGTSMATPHVAGAIGLIGQVLQEQGRNIRTGRFSADIIDILERSANTSKLPAWESEEQGAGRLDVHQAVRYAKGLVNLSRPNFGYPTPPYETGQYPGSAVNNDNFYNEAGCTGTLSWTARDIVTPVSPGGGIGQPPGAPPQRYGQHFIDVPPNTDRLRITARFNTGENLYLRLWRPGVNPDAESATPDAGPQPGFPGRPSRYHQSRVFPDQEAVGLVFTGNSRFVEVRAPEESNPGLRTRRPIPGEGSAKPGPTDPVVIPAGVWILRVYHRSGGAPGACNPSSQERPKQGQGHNYTLRVEKPRVTYRPSVSIDTPANDSRHTTRFVDVAGRAGYPPHTQKQPGTREDTAPPLGHVGYSWEGITNWEVPGSSRGAATDEDAEPDPNNPRPVLYMHGNAPEGCAGNGEADVVGCNGPFLLQKQPDGTPATWRTGIDDEVFDGTSDRSIHDPNWSWCLALGPGCPTVPQAGVPAGPKTVGGRMTVEWWAQCNLCGGIFSADWIIRVWGDGALKFEQRVTATPATLALPDRLVATVTLPTFTANQRIVVHIDPVFIDSQTVTNIYYDGAGPGSCTALAGRCDSLVRMPVGTTGGQAGGAGASVDNVRVTDLPANPPQSHPYPQNQPLSPALRVAWDPVSPAPARYEVYRSTDPLFPNGGTRVFSGPGTACTSPEAPTPTQPPGHDRAGLCYTDTGVSFLTTYYYRVLAVTRNAQGRDVRSANSEIAYGAPTRYDRQVKVKVDRLYGPQYWEYALLPPSPTPPDTTNAGTQWRFAWDTLELTNSLFAVNLTTTGQQVVEQPGLGHLLFARSFTQGIGSTKDGKAVKLDDDGGNPPLPPGGGCPDDDDGDGDDDADDGDLDDDGDDGDDDCEDDDDDEEDDDD